MRRGAASTRSVLERGAGCLGSGVVVGVTPIRGIPTGEVGGVGAASGAGAVSVMLRAYGRRGGGAGWMVA